VKSIRAVLLVVFLLIALTAYGQEDSAQEQLSWREQFFSWALHGSIFYFPAVNGVDSDPAPVIPSAGASVAFQFARLFKLEITEDLYFTNYEYNVKLGYPMACNPENRSAFVMGFLTGINAVFFLPFGNNAFRFFGGPAFDFRIIALAVGLNHPADFSGNIETDAQLQTDAIRDFFWDKGRWFMPAAGFGFDFLIKENLYLGFDIRTWFPIYKLWVEDNTSSIDGWRFCAGLRITFK